MLAAAYSAGMEAAIGVQHPTALPLWPGARHHPLNAAAAAGYAAAASTAEEGKGAQDMVLVANSLR